MANNEIRLGQIDYRIDKGIWEFGADRNILHDDYNRITLYTKRVKEFIKEKTGKNPPLKKKIKLTKEEANELDRMLFSSRKFVGIVGMAEPKDYDSFKHFYEGANYYPNEEYNDYDLIYQEV